MVQVRVVRIFNTYGPRMALDDGRVVSNFVAQALTDQDLTVYGDGQQTRSFQYVSDLIKGTGNAKCHCYFAIFCRAHTSLVCQVIPVGSLNSGHGSQGLRQVLTVCAVACFHSYGDEN